MGGAFRTAPSGFHFRRQFTARLPAAVRKSSFLGVIDMARRLTVGLLIEVEGTVDIEGYKTVLRTGIADCLREEDCHLICFAGGALQKSPYALEEKSAT